MSEVCNSRNPARGVLAFGAMISEGDLVTTFSELLLQPDILKKLIKINKTRLLKSRFLYIEFLILCTIPNI